jgi:hypothetical protein
MVCSNEMRNELFTPISKLDTLSSEIALIAGSYKRNDRSTVCGLCRYVAELE